MTMDYYHLSSRSSKHISAARNFVLRSKHLRYVSWINDRPLRSTLASRGMLLGNGSISLKYQTS